MRTTLTALLFLILGPSWLEAQDGADSRTAGPPVIAATRTTHPIRIDGVLDEAPWASASPATEFIQVDPEEGRPASERTEARILYDDEALYIGVRLYDTQRPTMRLGRRDMPLADSDWLGVVIDSYHDHRTGFSLDLNPAGVQRDALKSMSQGGQETDDLSWDAVWEARATVNDGGWTAEYRVPFSQLRFGSDAEPVWGIQLERVIGRRREYSVFSFTPKSEPGGIPAFGHLVGLRNIDPGNRLEVLPYAVARAERVDPGANPFRSDSEYFQSGGVDLLYRLTSDLTLNASINPDFGQVEADPAVVNLTVYETFFDEKRPFFIEGSEIFDFGRNTSGGRLFYTRRIGRSPQLAAPTAASDAPDATTILGAAKFSGKTSSGWSVGVTEAVTQRANARYLDSGGEPERVTVEPRTNYFVARARKDGAQGRTSFGAMATAVNRDLPTDRLQGALRSSAYAGGVDFRLESPGRTWAFQGSAAYSRVAGAPEALLATQRAGNHFFQRPDADHLEPDPDATSLDGYSVGVSAERQGGEHWRGDLAVAATSPAFEVNDLGFQTRTDRRDVAGSLTYVEFQPGSFFRNYSLTANVRYEHNYAWERILSIYALTARFTHLDFWTGLVRLTHFGRALDDRSTRGGPLMMRPANTGLAAAFASDGRKPVTVRGTVNGSRDEYDGWTVGTQLTLGVKTSDRWSLSLGPTFSRSLVQAQYVGTLTDPAATQTYGFRYLFAPLRQTTLAVETRFDLTFTPKLSFQVYAQPFIASGDYAGVGSLDAPRGYDFTPWGGELPNLDFNYRSLRGTAVLRWEWRPGSTLYVAWQQARADVAQGVGDFDFDRDRRALFGARPDNVFLVKVNYWLSP